MRANNLLPFILNTSKDPDQANMFICQFLINSLDRLSPADKEYKNYSKTCLKRPLKNRQTKVLKTNGSVMKVEKFAECSLGAFCNTFDLHLGIIGLENQFWYSF